MTRLRSEAGFTLVELLVATGMSAVVAAALAQATLVGWRTTSATVAQLQDTGNRQRVPGLLDRDVQSAKTVDTNNALATCVSAGDTLVVRMTWSEVNAGATVSQVAAYVAATVNGEAQLVRRGCDNTSGAMALTDSVILAHNVTAASTVTCYDASGAVSSPSCASTRRVSVSVTDASGTFTNTARRRTA